MCCSSPLVLSGWMHPERTVCVVDLAMCCRQETTPNLSHLSTYNVPWCNFPYFSRACGGPPINKQAKGWPLSIDRLFSCIYLVVGGSGGKGRCIHPAPPPPPLHPSSVCFFSVRTSNRPGVSRVNPPLACYMITPLHLSLMVYMLHQIYCRVLRNLSLLSALHALLPPLRCCCWSGVIDRPVCGLSSRAVSTLTDAR